MIAATIVINNVFSVLVPKYSQGIKKLYRVILKKVSFGIFRVILVSMEEKRFAIESQDKAISEHDFKIFGNCQNH